MKVDLNAFIDVIVTMVNWIKKISVVVGPYTVSLWEFFVAMGVVEAVSIIFEVKKYNDSRKEES